MKYIVPVRFLDDGRSFWLIEARQVEEVGLLMKLIKHSAGPVFDVSGGEDGNGVVGEVCSQPRASVGVFLG